MGSHRRFLYNAHLSFARRSIAPACVLIRIMLEISSWGHLWLAYNLQEWWGSNEKQVAKPSIPPIQFSQLLMIISKSLSHQIGCHMIKTAHVMFFHCFEPFKVLNCCNFCVDRSGILLNVFFTMGRVTYNVLWVGYKYTTHHKRLFCSGNGLVPAGNRQLLQTSPRSII